MRFFYHMVKWLYLPNIAHIYLRHFSLQSIFLIKIIIIMGNPLFFPRWLSLLLCPGYNKKPRLCSAVGEIKGCIGIPGGPDSSHAQADVQPDGLEPCTVALSTNVPRKFTCAAERLSDTPEHHRVNAIPHPDT